MSLWLAPCICIPKKNGEIHICVDYRYLKKGQKNSYPLPLPDEAQEKKGNLQVFSKSDCQKGFFGKHLFPFGLTRAPVTFNF